MAIIRDGANNWRLSMIVADGTACALVDKLFQRSSWSYHAAKDNIQRPQYGPARKSIESIYLTHCL
jgi:hypothetical protein